MKRKTEEISQENLVETNNNKTSVVHLLNNYLSVGKISRDSKKELSNAMLQSLSERSKEEEVDELDIITCSYEGYKNSYRQIVNKNIESEFERLVAIYDSGLAENSLEFLNHLVRIIKLFILGNKHKSLIELCRDNELILMHVSQFLAFVPNSIRNSIHKLLDLNYRADKYLAGMIAFAGVVFSSASIILQDLATDGSQLEKTSYAMATLKNFEDRQNPITVETKNCINGLINDLKLASELGCMLATAFLAKLYRSGYEIDGNKLIEKNADLAKVYCKKGVLQGDIFLPESSLSGLLDIMKKERDTETKKLILELGTNLTESFQFSDFLNLLKQSIEKLCDPSAKPQELPKEEKVAVKLYKKYCTFVPVILSLHVIQISFSESNDTAMRIS